MKHELLEMTRKAEGESVILRGEIWVHDAGHAILCIDHEGIGSRNFFERNQNELIGRICAEIGVTGEIDVFEEVRQGRYSSESGDIPYSDVARQGYRLLGIEDQLFTAGHQRDLIMDGTTTFDFGEGREALAADFHVWRNNKRQGLVLLDFPPDEKWRRVFREEPFANLVESTYGLQKGATIAVANSEYPELGRLFVELGDYVDGVFEPPQHTYAWAKFFATPLVTDALGHEFSEPLAFDLNQWFLAPELEL
jgi:hypothetical protein